MQGGGEPGQYIQELQLIVRASLPPELCCTGVHVYNTIFAFISVLQSAFLYGLLCIACGTVQCSNMHCVPCIVLHSAVGRVWSSACSTVQRVWSSAWGRNLDSGRLGPSVRYLPVSVPPPPTSLNFGSYSLVICHRHCQILVTITSEVECVNLLPLTFYNQKSSQFLFLQF